MIGSFDYNLTLPLTAPEISSCFYTPSYVGLFGINAAYLTAQVRILTLMPKKHQGPKDFAETAFDAFQRAIGEAPAEEPDKPVKNAAAVELGRLGGLKGGKARAAKLTPEQRSEIARNAVNKRWANSNQSNS
jgi:hypothetical protein